MERQGELPVQRAIHLRAGRLLRRAGGRRPFAGAAVAALSLLSAAPAAAGDWRITIRPTLELEPGGPRAELPDYAVPDLKPDARLLPELETPLATARPGVELILDLTGFRQDGASEAQVGRQAGGAEVRSAAIELAGEFGPGLRLSYKLGIDYNGFDVDPEQTWAISDFNVSFAIPSVRTKVSLGQMREDFGYEVVASTNILPQSERQISPFVSPVNFGAKVTHVLGRANEMTLSYGLFRDSWGEGDGKASVSARFTRLLIDAPDAGRTLHLGVGIRRADSGATTRYRGRPGVAAADEFVDTGDFPARAATHLGFEGQYADGPLLLLGEYVQAWTDAPEAGNPSFHGFYVLGSWMLTGERRGYDRTKGVVKRVVPMQRWGAPELVARYARVDLNGGAVRGGRYDRIEAGVNWWATTRWKAGLLWGHVWLDRFGETGRTHSLLTRIQWVY